MIAFKNLHWGEEVDPRYGVTNDEVTIILNIMDLADFTRPEPHGSIDHLDKETINRIQKKILNQMEVKR